MRSIINHAGRWIAVGVILPALLVGCQDGHGMSSGHGAGEGPAAEAIEKGRDYLWSTQRDNGAWPDSPETFPGGSTALAVWAMLESGVEADDPRIARAMAWLEQLDTDQTYTLAVRANAFHAAGEQGERADARRRVAADVARLVAGSETGGYSYTLEPPLGDLGDKSNSHYAVMGVEAGQAAGVRVPNAYWRMVMRYWINAQNRDGGWPYSVQGTPSSATMTAAGIATLGLAAGQLDSDTADPAIRRGLAWLDKNFQASLQDPSVLYYYFLALQRMGQFVDRERLGGRPWPAALKATLLDRQKPDGHWEGSWGPEISTAYAILVLSRQQ
jgi:hypothetical protein